MTHTFIFIFIFQFFRCYHIHETQHLSSLSRSWWYIQTWYLQPHIPNKIYYHYQQCHIKPHIWTANSMDSTCGTIEAQYKVLLSNNIIGSNIQNIKNHNKQHVVWGNMVRVWKLSKVTYHIIIFRLTCTCTGAAMPWPPFAPTLALCTTNFLSPNCIPFRPSHA